jgi:hypothetical protein
MGTENKEPKNKQGERKSGYFGGGVVWLFVLMAVAILVVVTYSSTTASVKIGYSDLEKLIVATGKSESGRGQGENSTAVKSPASIRVKVGSPPKEVEYSGLKDVILETHRVTGSVVRKSVDQKD